MPSALTGRQKAAVLLVALGPAASASVIRHLREVEIEQLTVEVFSTDEISEETIKEVLDESFEMTMASGLLGSGGYDYARQMLTGALGESKATEILSRLAVNLRPKHFDFLRDTDPAQLATFFQEYQPQAIALILSHLHPNLASKVLALLPADIQPEVAMRIATMERTSPEIIEGVESVLKRRLSSVMTGNLSTVGGIECLVKMLSMVDRTTERVILEYLDKHGPEVASDVRNQMFVFDNLTQLDDTSLQRVLREVDTRDLALAMRGASDDLRERIFRNLSSRAADILREDMAVSGPLRLRLVEEAQQKIVAIVRRLDEGGDIVIQRGDDVLV
jgi:flagellar motor switch protein FliG